MASPEGRSGSSRDQYIPPEDDDPGLFNGVNTRQIETFGRKVTATAGHLMGGPEGSFHNTLTDVHRELRRPLIQRSVFSFAQTTPRDLARSKFIPSEIQQRAISSLPDALLSNIPQDHNAYSLFQGFQATLPEDPESPKVRHGRHNSRGRKLLEGSREQLDDGQPISRLRNEKTSLSHRLEMLEVRKSMCATEIREIDNKISNLNTMRKIVLDRLAGLEQDEIELEHDLNDVDNRIEDMQEEMDDAAALAQKSPGSSAGGDMPTTSGEFMSQSIYQKLPETTPKPKKKRHVPRRVSTMILHEHLESGSKIKDMQAHNDLITALDFDAPFGTMVTASMDDTVRVWDLNAGRCMGMLEGHLSSVRCLQVEENIVATGSMDASIRLWDLSRADYAPMESGTSKDGNQDEDDGLVFENPEDEPPPPPPTSMQDCPLFSLEGHVAEVTALYLRGDMLVSGSSDKTLRQWDLVKGRCVQTLDVLWAAAQAATTMGSSEGQWRPTGRQSDSSADFVGALQCFDAALACGTADGIVRLWDLRSGQVHRSLVGHTGPITALQFDDVHMVTGSNDRSIRIWDLRTGSIFDAYAYDNPITGMAFDAKQIVSAAGEDVVKVYDKTDSRQWNCGPGVSETDVAGHLAVIEQVRIKEGYMVEGRRDGMVGVWSC
ncbi:WD40 repeat-like protein [Pseudovirgaria hyperparasitica]|uniref:Mitochondrial division protein 1 n=1 Tax=Pseudovirgaria hyperparasitica TaxID=470096 RepID=A0A6A6W0B8_9PEZI|nr:WD40 repeat-like protein [Pseudovirgaria hyperparasitica]KAF2755434.1 WD40 repeat-like protein [Pseudovirgaria hyperparasitica]